MNYRQYREKFYRTSQFGRVIERYHNRNLNKEFLITKLHEIINSQLPVKQENNNHGNVLKVPCSNCGNWKLLSEMNTDHEDNYVCNDCKYNDYSYCKECNKLFKNEDLNGISGNYYCDECRNTNFTQCYECDSWIDNNNICHSELTNRNYCESCYNSCFSTCEECGTEISSGRRFCDACNESRQELDYNYKPAWTMYGTDERRFGLEIEVVCLDDKGDCIKEINEELKISFCKHDGSLPSGGTEIVTHPADYNYIMQNKVLSPLGSLKNKVRSFKFHETGIHIHVTRAGISNLTIAKLIIFFSEYIPFIEYIAQRSHNHYCMTEKKNFKKIKNACERYEAINLCNKHTIEFRIFKGNLAPDRIYKNIEFVKCIIEFCEETGLKNVSLHNFLDYIKGTKYTYLQNFVKNYDYVEEL